ncbi:MAG: helix-turn-helix domain-containing protein [Candidatus Humimicrobiaceae bacterium]
MPKALSEYEKKIGKNVRNYRITNDIRQEQLAKYLNLPLQVISRMENGKRRITIEELEKIALFFDEPTPLFTQDEYKYIYPSDTPNGTFPLYMAEFFDDYIKGLGVDAGKDNLTNKYTKKFIEAIKSINFQIRDHQKIKEKLERNNLR